MKSRLFPLVSLTFRQHCRKVRGKNAIKITPACAGKSLHCFHRAMLAQDHPRVCWEKGGGAKDCLQSGGIAPACAGKRFMSDSRPWSGRDHPRICGEKKTRAATASNASGSPPRLRGKVIDSGTVFTTAGITPASAGKSAHTREWTALGKDHPRICGEKVRVCKPNAAMLGSPPRVRGTQER